MTGVGEETVSEQRSRHPAPGDPGGHRGGAPRVRLPVPDRGQSGAHADPAVRDGLHHLRQADRRLHAGGNLRRAAAGAGGRAVRRPGDPGRRAGPDGGGSHRECAGWRAGRHCRGAHGVRRRRGRHGGDPEQGARRLVPGAGLPVGDQRLGRRLSGGGRARAAHATAAGRRVRLAGRVPGGRRDPGGGPGAVPDELPGGAAGRGDGRGRWRCPARGNACWRRSRGWCGRVTPRATPGSCPTRRR